MNQEGVDLSTNPFFQNALVLDLLSWDIVSRSEADSLFITPWAEAEKVEKTGLRAVVNVRVLRWQLDFAACTSEVARRWPHAVFPLLSQEQ